VANPARFGGVGLAQCLEETRQCVAARWGRTRRLITCLLPCSLARRSAQFPKLTASTPELRTRGPELALALESGNLFLVDLDQALEVAAAAKARALHADQGLATGRTQLGLGELADPPEDSRPSQRSEVGLPIFRAPEGRAEVGGLLLDRIAQWLRSIASAQPQPPSTGARILSASSSAEVQRLTREPWRSARRGRRVPWAARAAPSRAPGIGRA
jgi:hypothetical protein